MAYPLSSARLTALVLSLAAAAPLAAQTGDLYKDRRLGFAVNPPAKWPQVPTEPQEEYAVAKWAGKRDFGNFATELNVLAFSKVEKKKPKPVVDDDEGFDLEALADAYGRGSELFKKAGTYQSYWRQRLFDQKFELPKPTKEVKVKTFDAKVRFYDLYRPGGQDMAGKPARYWYFAAVYDLPDRQFVLEFAGGEPVREKLLPLYTEVAMSMRLLPQKEIEAAEDEEAVAKLSEREKALRTAELTKRQAPGWWFKETENYVVLTSLPPNKADLIDAVASQLKKLRKIYEKDFPPPQKIEAVSIVRVCKSREEYSNYGGPGGSAGYWNAFQKELVMYAEGQKDFLLSVLNHEAFHQYIYYCFGELAPHSWYNEGFGDYYAGATFDGNTAYIKPFKWRTGTIKDAIRADKHVPVKQIVRYTQSDYYANADLCYAQGWSLIYFLKKGLPKGHPYERILPRYFEKLLATKDVDVAVTYAFDGVDYDRFETDWKAFIGRDQKPTIPK
jgi:hypothetical protein